MTTKGGVAEPDETLMVEMGKYVEELTKSGVLLAAGGLDPVGFRVTATGGEITVTDGPFAEAKEAVVSFALVEVRSRDEVLEISRRFWRLVGNGEGEVHEVFA